MPGAELPTPDFARNLRLIGYSDQGGRMDGVQIMVVDGFAYVGHQFSDGFSVIDVRDPRHPKTVNYIPSPPNTWSIHLQAADDLLLVINCLNFYREEHLTNEAIYYSGSMAEKTQQSRGYSAGIRVYDIKDRANPREIGFMPIDGVGVHRIWYTGGRWAYASALLDGFIDAVMITVDMADPTHPKMVGKSWIPGMNKAAGEVPGLGSETALFVPPSDRRRRHRLRHLARRRHDHRRRQGPRQSQDHLAHQLVPALWRGHAQRAAAPRPQPRGGGRRSRARRNRRRRQIHLALRCPRAQEPRFNRDAADARRNRLRA